jgi:hemerythrin
MAPLLSWSSDLSVGIDVIDAQHKCILDYINRLYEARIPRDRAAVAQVLEELVAYTLAHFSFEEAMLEEARYHFLVPHRRVHEQFVLRLGDFRRRFERGEDVGIDLQNTLVAWLMNHIRHDDAAYASMVRAAIGAERLRFDEADASGWLGDAMRRSFGDK